MKTRLTLPLREGLLGVALVLAGSSVVSTDSQAGPADSAAAPIARKVEVRGRIVCLAEEMHQFYQTDLPTTHSHLYGFKTTDGKFYTLLRTKTAEALFVDQRLQQEELILQARTFSNTQLLDVISVRSIHNGVVCDVYYYCNICSIVTIAPGPCMCCREPVELVEKPIGDRRVEPGASPTRQ